MYKLVFEDLFDQGKLNSNIWSIETGGHGFGNNESQYYTTDAKNIDLSSGHLILTAYNENYEDNQYTSGKISTFPKLLFQYGKIEVTATLPEGVGSWPAVWLLGASMQHGTPWPKCGEIDVMEHAGRAPGVVHASLHSQLRNFMNNTHLTKVYDVDLPYTKPHTYSIIWQEESISYEVDGAHIHTFFKPEDSNDDIWPFNHPFYLMFNLAVGGGFGGAIDDHAFPMKFHIYSIRYFKDDDVE
jgi:beta-glucanase (GH16 family)